MKVNMPITDNEVHFDENETLVSKTDLKGAITYVNKEFIRVSGFTEQELLGKNHNIVRHPDIPPEAFKDLWDTIKAGKPWVQVLKNRCKNGDYYWVKANVTPIWNGDQIVEYMSVRAKPTRDEIAQAELALRQIKDKKLTLIEGNPVKPGLDSWLYRWHNIRIRHLFSALALMFACLVGVAGWQLSLVHDDVEFSQNEAEGIGFVRLLKDLQEQIADHKDLMGAWLAGDKAVETRIQDARRAVDEQLDKLVTQNKEVGEHLGVIADLQRLERAWQALRSNTMNLTAQESHRQHLELIATTEKLMTDAGDASDLVLDPELATQYAIQLAIQQAPNLTTQLSAARGLSTRVVSEGRATLAERQELTKLNALIRSALEGTRRAYQNGKEASPRFKDALNAPMESMENTTQGFLSLLENVQNGSFPERVDDVFDTADAALGKAHELFEAGANLFDTLLEERNRALNVQFYTLSTLTTLFALLCLGIGFSLRRNILNTSDQSIQNMKAVASGDYKQVLDIKGNNELAALKRGLTALRIRMGFEVEDAQLKAEENGRIKEALDNCSTNVMVADEHHTIIYMNASLQKMFNEAEQDLQKDLPNFDASSVLGANMDIFHKHPEHQRQLIENLKETYRTRIKVGGRTFSLVATPVFNQRGRRTGTVVEWQDLTEILRLQEAEKQIAEENKRVRQALDTVSSGVMMADNDRTIIYANDAVVDILTNAQEDIQKDLPHFDVTTLLGSSIDQFHKNPAHQKKLLEELKGAYQSEITVGGRTMSITVNPVFNDHQERLGTVIEWADRTAEVAIEREVDAIVESAARGDLTGRLTMEGKTGFFERLSFGLNSLLDSAAQVLDDLGRTLQALSEGDLTQRIDRTYQGDFERIRNYANQTNDKLSEIIREIRETASTVRTAADEIAQGNSDLSQRTEEQASSLEETAASMEEMTSTVKQSADAAHEANRLSTDARKKAQDGGEVVHQAIEAMGEILKSSNRINDIIGVIDEIAFQTNLLALNAAVEAARAGEQGRGFAVVAGEVRNLSQRSAAAAKEIKNLIKDSVAKVEAGSTLVNESGETLNALVRSVEKVATMIEDISNAATEQTAGIEQINQAIAQMDQITQQNAALVEEASAASEALSEQAGNMARLVAFFKVGEDDHDALMVSAAPRHSSNNQQTPPPASPHSEDSFDATRFDDDDSDWEEF